MTLSDQASAWTRPTQQMEFLQLPVIAVGKNDTVYVVWGDFWMGHDPGEDYQESHWKMLKSADGGGS